MKIMLLLIIFSLSAFSISAVIHQLSEYPTTWQDQYVTVKGTNAYVADVASFRIFDISNPSEPILRSRMDSIINVLYVAVSSHIAYVCASELYIIDVSDASNPVILGQFNADGGAQAVCLQDTLAYVANNFEEINVINVADPQNPQLLGNLYSAFSYVSKMVLEHGKLYITGGLGLRIIDVSNPYQPEVVGNYPTQDTATCVAVKDDIAYITENESGMEIVNVLDPQCPVLLGTFDTPGYAQEVDVENNIAYVDDDSSCLFMIDISDPQNLHILGTYDLPDWLNSLVVMNQKAYVAFNTGFKIIDVSDPNDSHIIGSLDIPSNANSVFLVGDLAYIGDRDEGMRILDISNPSLPSQMSLYQSARTNSVTVIDQTAYLLHYSGGDWAGMQILDVSNPQVPQIISNYLWLSNPHSINVVGTIAYIDDGDEFDALSISAPQYPQELGSYWMEDGTSFSTIRGNLAFVTGGYGMSVLDISDNTEIQRLSSITTSDYTYCVTVAGNTAYVANYHAGIQVVDITNPANAFIYMTIAPHFVNSIKKLVIKDNLLFTMDDSYNEIGIYDISNPANPILINNYASNMRTFDLAYENGKLYTANRLFGFNILDISDIVPVEEQVAVPSKLTLSNYPNPFNPTTTIRFEMPQTGKAAISIYNIKGQKVKSLLDEHLASGSHTVSWNGMNDEGTSVASGVYFAKLDTKEESKSLKLLLLK